MSDHTTTVTRPPFMGLWCKHRFNVRSVARGAGVPENTIFAMLRWSPVEAQDAASVLAELGRIYQRDYSLKTVWVRLLEDGHATIP
jgi:hypothetical protein